MIENFQKRTAQNYWSYRWTMGENPFVFFGNPQARTNIIYTQQELKSILARSQQENLFIPVPRHILQNALDAVEGELTLAA